MIVNVPRCNKKYEGLAVYIIERHCRPSDEDIAKYYKVFRDSPLYRSCKKASGVDRLVLTQGPQDYVVIPMNAENRHHNPTWQIDAKAEMAVAP